MQLEISKMPHKLLSIHQKVKRWIIQISTNLLLFYPIIISAQSRDIRSHTQYGAADGDLRLKFEFYHDLWSERDVKHGKYSEWISKDRLKMEGYYFDGKQDSTWQYWYLNGNTRERSEWRDGYRHGKTTYYDNKGRIRSEYSFESGVKEGLSLIFFKNGRVKRVEQYHQNDLHGNSTTYKSNGVRKSILQYENGKQIRLPKEKKVREKKASEKPENSTTQIPEKTPDSEPSSAPAQKKGVDQIWENSETQGSNRKKQSGQKAKESKPQL